MADGDKQFVIELKSSGVTIPLDETELPAIRPGGFDPVQPVPHPNQSFFERYKLWLLIGGAALSCVLLLLLLLLIFHDSSRSEASRLLVAPATRVSSISDNVSSSPSIARFNQIGHRETARVRNSVSKARVKAQQIGNDEVRMATLALLNAEDELLNAYHDLGNVYRGHTRQGREVTRDVQGAVRGIDSEVSKLKSLEVNQSELRSPYPDEAKLNAAVDRLKRLLGS